MAVRDCLVVGERVHALEGSGPWHFACDGRHVCVERCGDGYEVMDRQGDGLLVRGERRTRHLVLVGDAVAVGRVQLLFASMVEPRTVRWQGMLATAMASLLMLGDIARAAASRAPVYLAGESGTGKELAARAVHGASERRGRPFVAINCAALPDALAESELFGVERGAYTGATRSRAGAFMQAQGGTLLLDEVGELTSSVLAKLLRALESGEVHPVGAPRAIRSDVRVVAASWKDLDDEVERGRFRHDLMHRLCVLRVDLVPLRQRREDIMPLVRDLLRREGAAELVPDPALTRMLTLAPWRGNVRELRNGVLRAAAARDPSAILPRDGLRRSALSQARQDANAQAKAVLAATLAHYRGNRKRSANALGISRSTLYRWLELTAAQERGAEVSNGATG